MGANLPSLYDLIEDYLLCCITEGKSPRTIEWYSSNLVSQFVNAQRFPI